MAKMELFSWVSGSSPLAPIATTDTGKHRGGRDGRKRGGGQAQPFSCSGVSAESRPPYTSKAIAPLSW